MLYSPGLLLQHWLYQLGMKIVVILFGGAVVQIPQES